MFLFCLTISLFACSEEGIEILRPEGACWKAEEVMTFDLEKEAAQKLEVQLLFTDDYSFSNIYLRLEVNGPDGWQKSFRQTETFLDPLGNWQVEQKGKLFPYTFTAFTGLELPADGKYSFRLTHDMRQEPLCGVEAIIARLSRDQ